MRSSTALLAVLLATLIPATAHAGDAVAEARAEEAARIELIQRVSKAFVAIGGGSGIVVSADGEILTNDHVAGSKKIGAEWVVIRPGGVFEKATLIAKDPRGDVALLKLVGDGPYPYVELGDSDALTIGQRVIALGNPFGFSKDGTPHVTQGVVSAVHRFQGGYSDAIQTDAAINPGNSGGPLLNMQGQLVGINGRIAVRFGTRANTGVGYAIPTNQIRAFMPDFRAGGVVSHGRVRGVRLAEAGGSGARVRSVTPGSPADLAGFQPGDLIIEAGGRPVHSPRRFDGIVGTLPAGAALPVKIRRNDDILETAVDLIPRDRARITKGAFLGIVMSPGTPVEIEEVIPGSPAKTAGIETGDVIELIDGRRVRTSATVIDVIGKKRPGQKVTLTLLRGEAHVELVIELGKRPK